MRVHVREGGRKPDAGIPRLVADNHQPNRHPPTATMLLLGCWCCRLQQQADQQHKQLVDVEDLLTNSSNRDWLGRQQLPQSDLQTVLTANASGS